MTVRTIDNTLYKCNMVDFYAGYVLIISDGEEFRIEICDINFITA